MSDLDARISCGLPDHHKMIKLERRCGAEGFKSFICLVLWCRRNKPSGILIGLTDEDVEIAARWLGTPGAFIKAMAEVRFFDGSSQNFTMHDWEEHNWYSSQEDHRTLQATRAVMVREVKNGRRTQVDADKIIKRKEKQLNARSSVRYLADHRLIISEISQSANQMIPTPLHSTPYSDTKVSGADAPQHPVLDPAKDMWARGVKQLGESSRGMIGKMRKEFGDAAVLGAIVAMESDQPSDPLPFFVKACEARKGNGRSAPSDDPMAWHWKKAKELQEQGSST